MARACLLRTECLVWANSATGQSRINLVDLIARAGQIDSSHRLSIFERIFMTISLPSPAVVLFVADVQKVRDFYLGVAGMELLHEDPMHAVLETAGFQMTVHALRGEANRTRMQTAR